MRTGFVKSLAAVAGAIAAFVPIGRCPACFAGATGVVGSLGLGWITTSPWFVAAIGVFLVLGLWGMTMSARAHGRWTAVWATTAGGALLVLGRLVGEPWLLWPGGAILTSAFILDLYWKRKEAARPLASRLLKKASASFETTKSALVERRINNLRASERRDKGGPKSFFSSLLVQISST